MSEMIPEKRFLSVILVLVLILSGMSITTHVKATNESSYRYGFNNAVSDYESCIQGLDSGDCNVSNDDLFSDAMWVQVQAM